MNQYGIFSEIYDQLMDHEDYDLWVELIERIIKKYQIDIKKIFELACGTGNMTTRLYKKGYSIIGTDVSENMLEIANEKALDEQLRLRFLQQDMREINYKKPVDLVISICDGVNYLTSIDDLSKMFYSVGKLLNERKGYYIFDISTQYKYEHVLSNNVFHENFELFSYIWDNKYDKKNRILEFSLTMFLKTEEDLFERFIEHHKQKSHSADELKKLAIKNNFKVLEVINEKGQDYKTDRDERAFFILKKN